MGGTYSKVNAMLHKTDISPSTLQALRRHQSSALGINSKSNSANNADAAVGVNGGVQLLSKGTPVTVFVKEVFKQSG